MNALPQRDSYRPDIDGLRSIAVVSVILFHAQLSCPGGFVGVDVFFVISGYLITKIIERDLEQRRFSVMRFYQRRIRRIFPALFAMFLVSACIGFYLMPPLELQDLGKSLVAAAAFCSNILFYRQSGYFDTSSTLKPLLHTWTLSVEEQFYIFWPLMLAAFSARFLSKWKMPGVLLILFGSLLLSAYWVNHLPNAAFYLLPSRAWELALGAVLSIAPVPELLRRLPRRFADVASLLGLAMLVASITIYDTILPFPGFAALLPCTGAALIIAAGEGGASLGGRVLSLRPLVWTGLISYSLYLWHWPILVFARMFVNRELHTGESVGLVVLTFGISWLSWRSVESPFRNPQMMGGTSRIWVVGGLTMTALFIAIGALLFLSGGFPQRSPEVARSLAKEQREANTLLTDSPCLVLYGAMLPPREKCLFGAITPASGYTVVLWGDSQAAHFASVLSEIGQHIGITTRQITKANCPPVPGIRILSDKSTDTDCPAFNDIALKTILADQQVRVVVLSARWTPLAEGTMAVPMGNQRPNSNDSRQLFVASLRRTLATLIGSGRKVILIGQVPGGELSPFTCLARARFNHWTESPCLSMPATRPARTENLVKQALSSAANANPTARILYPYDRLCGDQTCQLVSNGRPLYLDATHLSSAGARLIKTDLEKSITAALGIAETSGEPQVH